MSLETWQLVLVIWFGASFLFLLILAVVDWWRSHSLDREWKRFDA